MWSPRPRLDRAGGRELLLVNVDTTDGKDPSFFDSWDIFHLISVWAIFNSKLLVYQRIMGFNYIEFSL